MKLSKFFTYQESYLTIFFGALLALNVFIGLWKVSLLFAVFLFALHGLFLIFLGRAAYKNIKRKENFFGSIDQDWRLAFLFEALDDGVIVYDDQFRVKTMNRRAEEIAGVKKAEILNQEISPDWLQNPHFKVLVQLMYPTLSGALKRTGSDREVTELKISYPREMYLIVHSFKIKNNRGEAVGNIKLIKNKTEELRALRNQSEFITLAAHQLSTPTSEIKWGIEGLLGRDDISEAIRVELERFKNPLEKLTKVSGDLLGIVKMDSGTVDYQAEVIDASAFVREFLKSFELFSRQKHIRIIFEYDAELPRIIVDSGKFRIALGNIVDNAMRYSREGGEVSVFLRRAQSGNFVEIIVQDKGIGIPKDDFGQIGQKFFRAANALKFETEGSGLGIYIARSIVTRMGGDLKIISKENEGTTVTILLPTDRALVP